MNTYRRYISDTYSHTEHTHILTHKTDFSRKLSTHTHYPRKWNSIRFEEYISISNSVKLPFYLCFGWILLIIIISNFVYVVFVCVSMRYAKWMREFSSNWIIFAVFYCCHNLDPYLTLPTFSLSLFPTIFLFPSLTIFLYMSHSFCLLFS